MLSDRFGFFPKISTPVENIVGKRGLPGVRGAEIAISSRIYQGEGAGEADFTARAGDSTVIFTSKAGFAEAKP